MSPSAFKIAVVEKARGLLNDDPHGFRRRDIAARLGEDSPRLGRALNTLRSSGVLASADRGVFVAGCGLEEAGRLGPGCGMAEGVALFMNDNAGMASVHELRDALGLNGEADRKALARALRRGRYLPIGCGWWLAPDLTWRDAVLPGWRIAMAVRLEHGAYDLGTDNAMRARIAAGVRRARAAAGLDIEKLMEGDVGALLAADLARSDALVLTTAKGMRLSEWWGARLARICQADALALTWAELEEGHRVGTPWAGDALSAACWRAFAQAVGGDAVALSRGRTP